VADATPEVVRFLRQKDFILKQELGRGACGQTVLLYDTLIDEHFVCKKYAPENEQMREALFNNFVREIKLLHLVHHRNIVRLFNYYLYPKNYSGYILMEYVQGPDIQDYLRAHPEAVNDTFLQAVEGFAHLEANNILHRDIRPKNVLVTETGVLKIIDFGFGKKAVAAQDFDKSITLNWWCDPPAEFASATYDFSTEVYFVGKLFQQLILEDGIEEFKYASTLERMCARKPSDRMSSFSAVRTELLSGQLVEIDFEEDDLAAYRAFSDALRDSVSKIEWSAKYYEDVADVQAKLEPYFRTVMLEERVPTNGDLLRCFISGAYYFDRNRRMPVYILRAFIELLRASSREKRNIILGNLHARLDTAPRYSPPQTKAFLDDDIPF
jgi:serine/threonine-protein kinase